jgi:hypothetical protein
MTTEEVNSYLANKKGQSEEVKEPITPETEETAAEAPAETVEDKATEEAAKGVEQKQVEDKPDDKGEEPKAEVKTEEPKVEETPKEEPKKEEKKQTPRDYAFERLKRKSKEEKRQLEARIKELEEELNKGKGLKAEHFVDKEGKPDPTSYVDWKLKERDMQDEIRELQRYNEERQIREDIEEDKRRVESCFQDEKEREEYNSLIERNGKAFYDAVSEVDPNGVVFGYLSTMPEYPVVLRELMTDNKLLGYAFRSTDPDALKRNIAVIADQILDKRHNPISTPKEEPKVEVKVEPKKELPVIGKQINSTPGNANVVHDRNYWNRYLREHPRG